MTDEMQSVYALVAEGDKGEFIVGILTQSGNMPCVSGSPNAAQFLSKTGPLVAASQQRRIRLVRFATRIEIATYDPPPPGTPA